MQAPLNEHDQTASERELNARESSKLPQGLWDGPTKVELSKQSLQDLNRLNRRKRVAQSRKIALARPCYPGDLARFARRGGPDLCPLRGYLEPWGMVSLNSASMSTSESEQDDGDADYGGPLRKNARSSTPYCREFDHNLREARIYAISSSQKLDLADTKKKLRAARPSLSSTNFPDDAFDAFQNTAAGVRNETEVMVKVMPTILGARNTGGSCSMNTRFGNLAPLAIGLGPAQPDIYYGASPTDLQAPIPDELGQYIQPTTDKSNLMVPNFCLEIKGPDGKAAVLRLQTRHNGAIGARAMHVLQNYGREKLHYDNCAHAFSSTYHEGHLILYAHHITPPVQGKLEYHMTQIDSFSMIGNRDDFVRGATAIRNAIDLARNYRDGFIQAANARANQTAATALAGAQDTGPMPNPPDEHGPDRVHVLPVSTTTTGLISNFFYGLIPRDMKRAREPSGPDLSPGDRSPPAKTRYFPRRSR